MANGFIALAHPPESEGGSWGITFPDLDGCTSAADSFEKVAAEAQEALSGHLAAMRADGDAVPAPSTYGALFEQPEFRSDLKDGAMPLYVVPVDMPAPKERINVMIDPGILRQLDRIAKEKGASRSLLIETAVSEFIVGDLTTGIELLAKTVSGRQRAAG